MSDPSNSIDSRGTKRRSPMSGSVEDGRFAIAATARRMPLSFTLEDGDDFAPNGRLGVSPRLPQCVSCPSVPCIFGSTLRCERCETIGVLCDLFLLSLFSCRILLTFRRALEGLQIDEYNIAGQDAFFFGRRPLPFGGSHLRLPSGPAGIRTTTGSLSALARPTPYQLSPSGRLTLPDKMLF